MSGPSPKVGAAQAAGSDEKAELRKPQRPKIRALSFSRKQQGRDGMLTLLILPGTEEPAGWEQPGGGR